MPNIDSLLETLHLLRSPANARRLLASVASADAGLAHERRLIGTRSPDGAQRNPGCSD
jgi:antitoxin YefM